ncbi:MAG: hypothetical protein ACFFHD_13745 [Promethearchaeota archaeon]
MIEKNKEFHNISIIICPKCGFQYRPIRKQRKLKTKRFCPACGYEFSTYDLTSRKFDSKRF